MKVRIDIKKENVEKSRTVVKGGFFGKKTVDEMYTTQQHRLYLYIELTEEEKAIIHKNALDVRTVDEQPYNKDLLDSFRAQQAAAKGLNLQIMQESHAKYFNTLEQIPMSRFIDPVPRIFSFDDVVEANAYANRLKTKILPAIKEMIQAYTDHGPTSETLEF
jgi:hypothetical protein